MKSDTGRKAATGDLQFFSLESLLLIIENRVEQAERFARAQDPADGP